MKQLFIVLSFVSGLLALLLCCTDSPIAQGGSGTETVGGILVDTLGNPVQNAMVRIDSAGNDSSSTVYWDATNSNGEYLIENISSGTYSLAGFTPDSFLTVFIDNIVYADDSDTLDLGTDTMRAPGSIAGLVLLDSAAEAGVLIYIPGTSFAARSDEDGLFTMSFVPEGTYNIYYTNTGFVTGIDSSVLVLSGLTTILDTMNLIRDDNGVPPAPQNLSAAYDTVSGTVSLSWDAVNVSDLFGYYIYRKNRDDSIAFVKIGTAYDTLFTDTVFTDLLDTAAYNLRYAVKSVDTLTEESLFSSAVDVHAVSPRDVRTFFTWTMAPDTGDTVMSGDTVALAVNFTNATRINILIRWYTDDPLTPVRIFNVNAKDGSDTLNYIWHDTGSHAVCIEALDERGSVWRDSCTVSINGVNPTNTWQEFFPLLHARRYCGVSVVDSVMYVVGGAEDLFVGVEWKQNALASLESFSFVDSAWSSISTMPTARMGASVVSVVGKLFVMGGYTPAVEYADIEVFNTATSVWENPSPMPYIRFGHAACAVRDSIYVFGGMIKVNGSYTITDSIHAFDPSTGVWVAKGIMSTPRINHQVVSINDSVYILGGQALAPDPVQSVTLFNPNDNSITPLKDMSLPRMNFGATVLEGKIYVAGGFTSMISKEFVANVEAYDPSTNTWITRKDLPNPRHTFAVCTYNTNMYVIGGADSDYPDHLGQTASVLKYYP